MSKKRNGYTVESIDNQVVEMPPKSILLFIVRSLIYDHLN